MCWAASTCGKRTRAGLALQASRVSRGEPRQLELVFPGLAERPAGGFRSSVGVPISVEGRPWGLILVAYTRDQQLPADTEARLTSFTELVATAIANTESRASLARLAEEQAALWRVATLVARGAAPEEVFTAVA
ncbi:MAG TPA: GAF domain-containing protein, partial [Streptosporangiaceae bacterium]|nr:GAF domain-containing protein [Streptosporangiaceae bacterium]